MIAAFVLSSWVLVAFVAVAQLLGALDVPFAPYRLFYQNVVKPAGWAKPNVIADNPEPHRFAMLVGALFNGVATLALLAGVALAGGRATVTILSAPKGVVAGQTFELAFTTDEAARRAERHEVEGEE